MNQNLCETSIDALTRILKHTETHDETSMNSFELIGVHISIFTIFEEFSTYLINDFKKYLDEEPAKIFLLPKPILDAMTAEIDGDKIIKKYSEDAVHSDIVNFFKFQHFNKQIFRTSERKIDSILQQEKPFYENLQVDKILSDLNVSSSNIKLGTVTSGTTKSASLFIGEYSDDVRHIIAHKIVTQQDIQKFKHDYPISLVINNFEMIIKEIYQRYHENHMRDVYRESEDIDTINTTV